MPEAVKAVVRTDKVCQPDSSRMERYDEFYSLYREIYPALKGQFFKACNAVKSFLVQLFLQKCCGMGVYQQNTVYRLICQNTP